MSNHAQQHVDRTTRRRTTRAAACTSGALALVALVAAVLIRTGHWPLGGGHYRVTPASEGEWPFTVRSGVVRCSEGVDGGEALTVTLAGRTYVLDQRAADWGYPDIDPQLIPVDGGSALQRDLGLTMVRLDAREACSSPWPLGW